MPPKIRITEEMVSDAAFQIARQSGWESINARTVAKQLHCSTQPVMYHFSTMEELKQAAYQKADCFHSEFLMNVGDSRDPLLAIGLNYIRFGLQEPGLFRFLFQSGYGPHTDFLAIVNAPELEPLLQVMAEAMGLSMEKTKEIFVTLAVFAHGYASLLANHYMEYDEALAAEHLTRAYYGAVAAAQEETDEETV